ncbi:ATP-binding protein [Mycoplasma sp. ATU-Cv-508]|uniref:ATP-binding protein n=1 Tax=Mycoplasma sp. ATU-Cv-508 TaxID=2048001 RepID=UPI000FDF2153
MCLKFYLWKKACVDLVVFDEGSQIYVEKAIPTILRGQKVVIAGDNKQPVFQFRYGRIDYDEETDDEDQFGQGAALEEESLLDLARAKYHQTMLDYHYRSKYEELIAFF